MCGLRLQYSLSSNSLDPFKSGEDESPEDTEDTAAPEAAPAKPKATSAPKRGAEAPRIAQVASVLFYSA